MRALNAGGLALLAAAGVGVQVGFAIAATRFAIGEVAPVPLAMLRYAVGALCLVPALAMTARIRVARRDILPLAALGIGQFGILIALMNWGLQYVPAGRAALIFATFPLLTLAFAAAFGHERLTAGKVGGVALSIVGVGVALLDKLGGQGGPGEWWGAAAVLASAALGALCSVLYRPYLRRYPVLPLSAIAMAAAVGFLAVLSAADGYFAAWPRYSATAWIAIVLIGLSSGIGYFLWLYALRHTSATRVTVFLALSPLTAALIGALFLGEAFTLALGAGLALVALGLWLATRGEGGR